MECPRLGRRSCLGSTKQGDYLGSERSDRGMARRAGAQRPGNGSEGRSAATGEWLGASSDQLEVGVGKGGHRRPAGVGSCLLHRRRRRHAPALGARGHRRTGRSSRPVHPAAARSAVVAGQLRGRRGIRAAGRGARLRFGPVGPGGAGHVIAVRAAHPGLVDTSPGEPFPVDLGGAACGVGRGDRHRRQSDPRSFAGLVRDMDAGARRAGTRTGGVRDRRQVLLRTRQRRTSGDRFGSAVGTVRGTDQGCRSTGWTTACWRC